MPECSEPIWVRSPFSGDGTCVEITRLSEDEVGFRNSRRTADPALVFTQAEWDAFLVGVKHGSFDGI
jgi:hypothetical protein